MIPAQVWGLSGIDACVPDSMIIIACPGMTLWTPDALSCAKHTSPLRGISPKRVFPRGDVAFRKLHNTRPATTTATVVPPGITVYCQAIRLHLLKFPLSNLCPERESTLVFSAFPSVLQSRAGALEPTSCRLQQNATRNVEQRNSLNLQLIVFLFLRFR